MIDDAIGWRDACRFLLWFGKVEMPPQRLISDLLT